MLTAKARVPAHAGYSPVLPVVLPSLSEVRDFAHHLHSTGKAWQGEFLGWPAAYTPQSRAKPKASKMRFTPAEFWIGESGIWFYSLMWEHGRDKAPVAFLDDRGIVKSP